MANARKVQLNDIRGRALRDYADQAKSLSGVAAVAYLPLDPTEVFTYIDERDDDLCHLLYEVEDRLFESYNEQLFGFHIRALDGRDLTDVVDTTAELLYARADA